MIIGIKISVRMNDMVIAAGNPRLSKKSSISSGVVVAKNTCKVSKIINILIVSKPAKDRPSNEKIFSIIHCLDGYDIEYRNQFNIKKKPLIKMYDLITLIFSLKTPAIIRDDIEIMREMRVAMVFTHAIAIKQKDHMILVAGCDL